MLWKEVICEVIDIAEKKAKELGYKLILRDIHVAEVVVEVYGKVIDYDGDGEFEVQYDKHENVTDVWINDSEEGWVYLESESGKKYLVVWKDDVVVVGYLFNAGGDEWW